MQDTRYAVWLSHSSIGDYLKCPRSYYLKNLYKNPQTGRKITLMQPSLALGQAVHGVLESLQSLPVDVRLKDSLLDKYDLAWEKVRGKWGGFSSNEQEEEFKQRGREMLERVMKHPGPLLNKALTIPARSMMIEGLPSFYLSEEDNIILCGKVDWLEYIPETDSVHILDFKTGKNEEKAGSLQLPIYHLLVKHCQNREVSKASYWYLDSQDKPVEVALPDIEQCTRQVLDVAQSIKLAREDRLFDCSRGGCFACSPYEEILNGEAQYVGVDEGMNKDVYIPQSSVNEPIVEGLELEEVPI
ncbi:MAG: PD-(D/E)XK nuclease family protein [bacterium]